MGHFIFCFKERAGVVVRYMLYLVFAANKTIDGNKQKFEFENFLLIGAFKMLDFGNI